MLYLNMTDSLEIRNGNVMTLTTGSGYSESLIMELGSDEFAVGDPTDCGIYFVVWIHLPIITMQLTC